jgi:hypothetical protein
VKQSIEVDEWYPVFVMRKPTTKRGIYNIPSDIYERYMFAFKQFQKSQDELSKWYCEQNGHEDGYMGACWCGEVPLDWKR